MATSARIRGNQGLVMTLKKGAAAAASYADDVKSWSLNPDDADDSDLTFAEAASGSATQWTLNLTALFTQVSGSLWKYLWDNPATDLVVVLGPEGNATPSTAKPHYTFTINTGNKPPLQNEARTSKEGAEFEKEFTVIGDVTAITA